MAIHHFEVVLGIPFSFNWHGALFSVHCTLARLFRNEGRFDDNVLTSNPPSRAQSILAHKTRVMRRSCRLELGTILKLTEVRAGAPLVQGTFDFSLLHNNIYLEATEEIEVKAQILSF